MTGFDNEEIIIIQIHSQTGNSTMSNLFALPGYPIIGNPLANEL